MRTIGLSRRAVAEFISERTGYRVPHTVLHFWEETGLLPSRGRGAGRWTPALYDVRDIVRACIVAELRRSGASLQRIRIAVRWLGRNLPELEERPGSWRLAVTSSGDVVRIESDAHLLELTRTPGQITLFNAAELLAAARAAIEEHRAEAIA